MSIEQDADKIQPFVESGNYHAALNIAISCLNECRRNDDQECIDNYLRIINDISLTMAREFGSKAYLAETTK